MTVTCYRVNRCVALGNLAELLRIQCHGPIQTNIVVIVGSIMVALGKGWVALRIDHIEIVVSVS